MFRKMFVYLLILTVSIAACDMVGNGTEPETEIPTLAQPVETPVVEETPTATAEAATSEPATETPEATATAEATATTEATATPEETPTAAAEGTPETELWPGIVYQDEAGLWQVDEAGEPQMLVSQPEAQLSPDGDEALYIEDDNVWIVDVASGETRNVTEGSERLHSQAQWWPENPDILLLTSRSPDTVGPTAGELTLVNRDGSEYQVVNEEADSNGLPAPASDGETIAYDEAGSAWLYHVDEGREPFDVAEYDLPEGVSVPRIASPAWSPDMTRIAWVMAVEGGEYGTNGGWEIVLGIFDLEAGTAQLIHPFEPVGRGGWFPNPVWSPDGEWISYTVETMDEAERGRWVIASDGSGEQTMLNVDAMSTAVWSPEGPAAWHNGAYLLVDGQQSTDLFESGTWEQVEMPLPADARIVDWRALNN